MPHSYSSAAELNVSLQRLQHVQIKSTVYVVNKRQQNEMTDFNGEVFVLDRLHLTTKGGQG